MHLEKLDLDEPDFTADKHPLQESLADITNEFVNKYNHMVFNGVYIIGVSEQVNKFLTPDMAFGSWLRYDIEGKVPESDRYNELVQTLVDGTVDGFYKNQIDSAYERGRLDGYQDAYNKGYLLGQSRGKSQGFAAGKVEVNKEREKLNKADVDLSYMDGYNKGYDDGKNDR